MSSRLSGFFVALACVLCLSHTMAQESSTKAEAGEVATKEAHAESKDSHDAAGGHETPGGHGHDTTDLGHANASDVLNTPAAVPYDLAIGTFVVFVALMALLGKFAWGPIATALDDRERHIATMISTAEQNAAATEKRLKELEAQLAAQAEAAREAISQARREGEVQKEKILQEAAAAAVAEKERAVAEIRNAKNIALREIAQYSVNSAVDLAKNIVRREVKPADHETIISETLARFQNT